MKLSVRFAAGVTIVFLAVVGSLTWLLASRIMKADATISALTARIGEREKELKSQQTQLMSVKAGQGAAEISKRAAGVLDGFVTGRVKALRAMDLAAAFGGTPEEKTAAAAALLSSAGGVLDQVIVTDGSGAVAAVAPPNAALVGQPFLTAAEVAATRKSADPRVAIRVSDKSPARLVVISARMVARVGGRGTFLGILAEVAALETIVKGVAGSASGETETRFMLVDQSGVVAYAPTPDLVGKALRDSPELKVLTEAADAIPVEVAWDLRRWIAVRHAGPLGLSVIGLGAVAAGPSVAGAGAVPVEGLPIPILAGIAVAGLVLLLWIVMPPLGRIGSLAKSAETLASGSASVDFKGSGAGDEIGAAARALEKVGSRLSDELHHRDEAAAAYATIQRDLSRVQSENRELQEYQRNLEAKGRQQQAALDGELAAARQELEAARAEVEAARKELSAQQATATAQAGAISARDAAIAERDAALVQAGQQIQSLTESLAALQQSVESLSGRLAEANAEIDRHRSAPAAAFGLFAEASEALSVELAGLVELVQGYIGQLVEAGAITEEQQQFLSTVITRSARSQRLMGDLRDFSNIVKPDGLAREPIDLGALLTDVVGSVQEGAEARGITLDADVPQLPEAIGDEGRLRQLFTVLFQNAIRFTPEAGSVTMRVGVREGIAGVRIEDGAESIPVKSDEVFDHFHPTDEEILELRGSGLRFPILRAIAAAHGGAIDLAITEQGSNLFFVRLPVRSEAPTADQTAALFAGVAGGETGAAETEISAAPPAAESPAEVPSEAGAPSAETAAFAEAFAAFASQPGSETPAAPPPEPAAEPPVAETPPSAEAPAEISAEAAAFAEAFAAFSASPAPAEPGAGAAPAEVPPPPPGVETTDSIMAAAPEGGAEAPPAIGLEDLWTVPDAGAPPTVESIESAGETPPAPPPLQGPAAAPNAAPPGEPKMPEDEPPKPFSFGSDEILSE